MDDETGQAHPTRVEDDEEQRARLTSGIERVPLSLKTAEVLSLLVDTKLGGLDLGGVVGLKTGRTGGRRVKGGLASKLSARHRPEWIRVSGTDLDVSGRGTRRDGYGGHGEGVGLWRGGRGRWELDDEALHASELVSGREETERAAAWEL